jgi:hypothetical protein
MLVKSVEQTFFGPVSCKWEVVVEVQPHVTIELEKALNLINSFRKTAFKAINTDPTEHSDWTMVDFDVVNLQTVKISIESGACG